MAVPSEWGDVVDGYGKIGIFVDVTYPTAATASVSIEVWISTKYSATDVNNNFWFDDNAQSASTSRGSRSIKTTVNSGAWSTGNYQKIYTYPTFTVNRTTSNQTRYCAATLNGVEIVSGTMTHMVSYTINALDSYDISYNPNGKNCTVPTTHKKYYGVDATVSSTVPTTEGYTCTGWVTAAPEDKFYPFGGQYAANAPVLLYANWVKNKYKITLDPKGGTINSNVSPVVNEKEYGEAYALPTPVRSDYNFLGWSTSQNAATVDYAPGASYTSNSAVALYAVWELAYVLPTITDVIVERCDANGNHTDEGTYFDVAFNWATDEARDALGSAVYIRVFKMDGTPVFERNFNILDLYTSKGYFSLVEHGVTALGNGEIDTEYNYTVSIMVMDSNYKDSSVQRPLRSIAYPIDILAEGKGISFGGPAKEEGVMRVHFQLKDQYNTKIQNGVADWTGGTDSEIDPNETLERWIITSHENGPLDAGYYFYIETVFDSTKTLTAGRMQKAYSANGPTQQTFYRSYYDGAWSPWVNAALAAYPINSIYISYSHDNPETLFGGKWTRIANRFLLGCDADGDIGATGGASTVALDISEMPKHSHPIRVTGYGDITDGAFSLAYNSTNVGYFGYNADNGYLQATGGGEPHENMPPYIQVSIWMRTA